MRASAVVLRAVFSISRLDVNLKLLRIGKTPANKVRLRRTLEGNVVADDIPAMDSILRSDAYHIFAQILIGSVWIFHGLYSKLLNGIPRHRLIVGKILGPANAGNATKIIGLLEVLLGLWVFTGWQPVPCAVVQTAAIVAMNALEIFLAAELLISAVGMVILNLCFLSLVWHWALVAPKH